MIFLGMLLASCSRGVISSPLPIDSAKDSYAGAPSRVGSFQVLYSFKHGSGGSVPQGFLVDVKGMLYGITSKGRSPCVYCGTVFAVSTSGKEHVVYAFTGGSDGGGPGYGGLLSFGGMLYGTTDFGGSNQSGTIFQLSASGKVRVLYNFTDEAYRANASLFGLKTMLYGTTIEGGGNRCYPHPCGTVFAFGPVGFRTRYQFKGYPRDGANPYGPVTAVNGTLYGTTTGGGNGYGCARSGTGCGAIFALNASGKERVLYNFKGGGSDGAYPIGGLLNLNGTLYGVTQYGGNSGCQSGCGTVFSVTIGGKERVLHRFTGGSDGAYPAGGLTAINGTLYGTTLAGGAQCAPSGRCGTVFAVDKSGSERILYRFTDRADGKYPGGGLLAVDGMLFGTTSRGGTGCPSCGTVFRISP
jgi:uncharacterized repeat protein (TIGR03803 family)